MPAACAGICRLLRPDCYGVPFCAGNGYLFLRGKGNTSRLRGNMPPFTPGLLRSTFLRGKGVSFSAREGKYQPPAREIAPFSARIAKEYLSAREMSIFFCAEFLFWKLLRLKREIFFRCMVFIYDLSVL